MKGAKDKARADDPLSTNFSIAWDYIEVPVGFNFNDKKVFMVGLGVAPSVLVRDKETINGVEEYVSPSGSPPKKFDLPVYFNVSFLIKRVFAITGRFSYSTFGLRDSYPGTKVSKQYNNVITLRLMYILSTKKKK